MEASDNKESERDSPALVSVVPSSKGSKVVNGVITVCHYKWCALFGIIGNLSKSIT